ncbi:transglycosylase SLT domain-containing protein [Leuconostoc mesenteroides]|nr:transglycosylase SLT domain-containing protein [Leuconostoc mesenteroides]
MSVMINRFPMFGEALQKATGKSMKELYAMSAAGKLSATQFTEALDYLGEKYKGGTEEAMTSMQGMSMYLHSRLQVLSGEVMKSSFDMSKSATSALQRITSDDSMKTFADGIGQAMGGVLSIVGNVIQFIEKNKNTIVAVFGGIKDVVVQVFGLIGNALSLFSISFKANVLGAVSDGKVGEKVNGIKKAFDGLVEAIKPIASAVGGFVGVLAGGVVSTIVKVVQGIADSFTNVGDSADKSKKKLDFTAIFGIIVKLSQSLNDVFTVLGEIAKPLGEIIGSIASGAFEAFSDIIGLIVDGLKHLSGQAKEASDKTNPLAKALGKVAKHKKALEAVGLAVGAIATAMIAVKGVVGVFKMISSGITTVRIAVMLLGDTWKALNAIMKANIFVIIVTAIVALGIAFYELYKHNKKFKKFVDDCVNAAANFFKGIGKWFGKATKAVGKFFKGLGKWFKNIGKSIGSGSNAIGKWFDGLVKGFVKGWNSFIKTASKVFSTLGKVFLYALLGVVGVVFIFGKLLYKAFEPIFTPIVKLFKSVFKGIVNFLSSVWKPVQKAWGVTWKAIQKTFTVVFGAILKFFEIEISVYRKILQTFVNFVVKVWEVTWNFVLSVFKSIWNALVKFFKPIIEWLSGIISDTMKFISKAWNKVWQAISDFFGDIWKSIKKTGSNSVNSLSDTISGVMKTIDGVWRGMWKGLSDFFGGIWKDIKGYAEDGINGVVKVINAGVDGIDSVWKFFTGHETSVKHLKPVKLAAGGVIGGESQLAMVNDGVGSNWKELIQLPNGEMTMSNKRNHIMPLPKGTRVYNGEETKSIMGMAGIKKYADGGIVGDAIDWGKGKLSDVGSWIGDKMEAITKFLKNPASAIKGIITKSTSGLMNGLGHYGEIATGTFDKLTGSIASWFSKGLKKVQDEEQGDGGGGKGAPSGSGVTRWKSQVVDALKANGLSTSSDMVNKVLRQIATESGGNEKAVQGNIGDINNKTGDLAKGLMQVITSTFNANKFPGHNNPFNGYDSLLAGLNYAKKTYGSNLSFLGQGHGYANGGRTNGIGIVGEVEGEDEWVTNSNRPTADSTIIGSIKETAQKQPNSFAAKLAGVINGAKSGMQAITSQQPIIAGSSAMQSANGGIDLSGDVHMTVQLDSGEIARAVYPKTKILQNQEIQLKGQVTGNTYVY